MMKREFQFMRIAGEAAESVTRAENHQFIAMISDRLHMKTVYLLDIITPPSY